MSIGVAIEEAGARREHAGSGIEGGGARLLGGKLASAGLEGTGEMKVEIGVGVPFERQHGIGIGKQGLRGQTLGSGRSERSSRLVSGDGDHLHIVFARWKVARK